MIAHATAEPWRLAEYGLGDLSGDLPEVLIALILFVLAVLFLAWLASRKGGDAK